MNQKYFRLTEEHLALMSHLWFEMDWDHSIGVPTADPIRPYGNQDIINDVCDILDFEKIETINGEMVHTSESGERARKIHKEIATAIEVCLTTLSFEPGLYVSDPYSKNWRPSNACCHNENRNALGRCTTCGYVRD